MSDILSEDLKNIKTTLPIKVGARIKALRESKNLTQTELSFKIGSDRQYLYKIESAKVSVGLVKLTLITNVLEITLSEFFSEGF
jgi:transcriptional regulator with XRE-family HTH domain